jgi:MFS transporter, CP family, cyanate transporter
MRMKSPGTSHSGGPSVDKGATPGGIGEPSAGDRDNAASSVEATPPYGSRTAAIMLAASLVLISFSLRTPITSVGPILLEAVRATGLTPAGASLLTTLPSLCFGFFGPLAPMLARRLGTERALLVLLALLSAGIVLRVVPTWPALYAGQVIACFAIGLMNVLLPGLVKRDFPHHVALMTGFYSAAMCAGAAAAAAATVPMAGIIERAIGTPGANAWAYALALWGLPAALAALAWAAQLPPSGHHARRGLLVVRGLWRDPLAWQVTLFMGSQSSLAYIVFGWLPTVLRGRGMSAVDAGVMLSLSMVAQAVASLSSPMLATRGHDQRAANVIALTLTGAALMGCFFAPLSTLWGWAVLLGLAQGTSFTLALTVIGLRSPDSHVAAQLSGMAQGVGYLIASGGPFVAGSLLHATGSLSSVTVLCGAICAASAWSGYAAGRPAHVKAQVERQVRV